MSPVITTPAPSARSRTSTSATSRLVAACSISPFTAGLARGDEVVGGPGTAELELETDLTVSLTELARYAGKLHGLGAVDEVGPVEQHPARAARQLGVLRREGGRRRGVPAPPGAGRP